MRTRVSCYECDSEYQIQHEAGELTDDIQYCVVCAQPLELPPQDNSID